MIPILYDSAETAFTSNGLGRLIDATSCEVTEERNGQYELVMKYPVDGQLYDQLVPGNYIAATHEDSNDIQPFQIYQVSAPLQGLITINAWHISYMLNGIIVGPYTASTCAAALSGITSNSMNTNPFTFWTDKTLSASFKLEIPAAARSVLGGMQGSILDIYGPGEFEFDKWTVKFHTARGANNGVSIRYGKNIRSLDYQLNAANQYNAVAPYWTNDETAVVLDHLVVRTGQTADRAIALDLSSEFESQPTTAQLEAAAQAYIDASTNYQVKDNLKIDIVPIWEASEYQYNPDLDAIKLCDTVTIIYGKYNINATAKVIKVVYNTLLNRYDSIELGEPQTTLSQQIAADVSGGILAEVPRITTRMLSDISFKTTGDIEANSLSAGALTVNGHTMTPIEDLPVDASPAATDYLITNDGSTTRKSTLNNVKSGMGLSGFSQVFSDTYMGVSEVRTYTLQNYTRGILVISGHGNNSKGLYLFASTSAGEVTITTILSAANAAVAASGTNTITITKSSNSVAIYPTFICTNNKVTR